MSSPSTSSGIPRRPQPRPWWIRMVRWLFAPVFAPPLPNDGLAQQANEKGALHGRAALSLRSQHALSAAESTCTLAGRGPCLYEFAIALLRAIPGMAAATKASLGDFEALCARLRSESSRQSNRSGAPTPGLDHFLEHLRAHRELEPLDLMARMMFNPADNEEAHGVANLLERTLAGSRSLEIARAWPEGVPQDQPGLVGEKHSVTLHNDDATTFAFVIDVLERIGGLSVAEAEEMAVSVHNDGRGTLAGLSRSRAAEIAQGVVREAIAQHFPLVVTYEAERD